MSTRKKPVGSLHKAESAAPEGATLLTAQDRAVRAQTTGGEPTVDYPTGTPYELYVGVQALVSSFRPYTEHYAEPAFLITTQVMELYFLLLRQEWNTANAQLRADDLDGAILTLRRTVFHLEALNAAWKSLVWLTPAEFNGFRDQLGEASGFQSYLYRHVEFLLGLKSETLIRPHKDQPEVYAGLLRDLAAPSLYDEVVSLLARQGFAIPSAVLNRDFTSERALSPEVEAAWVRIYSDPRPSAPLFVLAETLTDIADEFTNWRHRHVMAVRRSMGAKPGSAGSSGLAWLERSLARPVFAELWSARTLV